MNVNTNYGINNNNYTGPRNELAARLAQWTPEGQPNLDFILNISEDKITDINTFLIKAEESTHFDKNELKKVVYKILNSLRTYSNLIQFSYDCKLDSRCLFQFLNKKLITLEKVDLKSQPISQINSEQIINLAAKLFLHHYLSYLFKEKYFPLQHELIEPKIPPEMEARYMAADSALREMLFIPKDLTYQNIENDPLNKEEKEKVYGAVTKAIPTYILNDFDGFIDNQPEIKIKEKKIGKPIKMKLKAILIVRIYN